jgi:hypothetical protein
MLMELPLLIFTREPIYAFESIKEEIMALIVSSHTKDNSPSKKFQMVSLSISFKLSALKSCYVATLVAHGIYIYYIYI